ncbi:MAG TPA: cold-shock protein [Paenibacillus sp.]|uniref:cold-shock protein n=1 Tax=Paenibacillus sp. TaxID=58172 RepID=UPI0028D51196|nr:cold-shock protein [Paenibacillus sp.]HUC92089.1 cold-shock protein [Paenibacillus sp.]
MYSRKKPLEEIPLSLTEIWTCTTDGCNLWMRNDFTFEQEPLCRHCGAPMVKSTKMLSLLVNTDKNYLKK